MSAPQRCIAPRPTELWTGHLDELRSPQMRERAVAELYLQKLYWLGVKWLAARDVDFAREQMAAMLAASLEVAQDELEKVDSDPGMTRREKERRAHKAITLLAMSSFGTVILPQEAGEALDGVGVGIADTVLELNKDKKGFHIARLHSPPDFNDEYFDDELAVPRRVWYSLGDLFICREPSVPGDNMPEEIAARGIEVDFSALEMLTPHVRYAPNLL